MVQVLGFRVQGVGFKALRDVIERKEMLTHGFR